MLTRVPLAFDLSLITASAAGTVTAQPTTPEVVLFVTCPCIGGGGGGVLLQHATPSVSSSDPFNSITTTTTTVSSCYLGVHSPNPTNLSPATTLSNPRWCFPDPNSLASVPTTPTPGCLIAGLGKGSSPPYFPTRPAMPDFGNDFERLELTQRALRTSGFYYEGLTWQRASEMLRGASAGTFLVRDSADPRHLYSLSVQTDRGPTSVRIHYADGRFRLDCEDSLIYSMPTFDCVLKLIEHYVQLSQTVKGKSCVWLDGSGKRDLRVRLYRPLYARVPSLQHACRNAARAFLTKKGLSEDELGLPSMVKDYLKDYPYWL